MKISSFIQGCQLFSDLGKGALSALEKVSVTKEYGEGQIIFSEGDDAEALFILMDGQVDLLKSSAQGKEQLVRQVEGGEMFAEAAMFSGATYPATAIAKSGSRLIVITKNKFLDLVRIHPEVAIAIIGTMSKLLRHLNHLLSDLSLGSVTSRLAAYLLHLVHRENSNRVQLDVSKKELAYRLGTVPETLSRNLKKLRGAGVIEVAGQNIIINDINALEDLSRD